MQMLGLTAASDWAACSAMVILSRRTLGLDGGCSAATIEPARPTGPIRPVPTKPRQSPAAGGGVKATAR